MTGIQTVENAVLSRFGLGVIWVADVALPMWIARRSTESFLLPSGPLRFIRWIPIALCAAVILWRQGLFLFVADGDPWPIDPPG